MMQKLGLFAIGCAFRVANAWWLPVVMTGLPEKPFGQLPDSGAVQTQVG
jgi:hypothetical protein